MAAKIDFGNYYTVAQLTGLLTSLNSRPEKNMLFDDPRTWGDALRSQSEALSIAIGRHLVALRDAGLLARIPFAARRGARWANAWNRLVGGAASHFNTDQVVQPIHQKLYLDMSLARMEPAEAVLAELVETMNAGAFDGWELGGASRSVCEVSGINLGIMIAAGWSPKLISYAGPTWSGSFMPVSKEAGEFPALTLATA